MSASTRHLADIALSAPGDDGETGDDLARLIVDALRAAGLEVLDVSVSDDIGLGAEDAAFCRENDDEFLYFPVDGATVRRSDFENNWEPYVDARNGVAPMLRF